MSDRDKFGRYEGDDDERRDAFDERRARRRGRTVYRTYDDWKLASPDDDDNEPRKGP